MPDIRNRLIASFSWIGDGWDAGRWADESGWWRDAAILDELGAAFAELNATEKPTVIVATESRGTLIGALVARELGVGLAEVRKNPPRSADSEARWEISTAPDYNDRHLRLGLPKSLLSAGDRVLFIDDWIATGAQATACQRLVEMSGARWLGAAVIVDGLEEPGLRRQLKLQSLLHIRDL